MPTSNRTYRVVLTLMCSDRELALLYARHITEAVQRVVDPEAEAQVTAWDDDKLVGIIEG